MKTNKYILVLVLALCCAVGNLYAITSSYYSTIDGKSASGLRDALTTITSAGPNNMSYDKLWTAYQTTDVYPSGNANAGKIWDMYGNCTFTYSTNQCGNYSNECDCYNREHSLPKSWFAEEKPAYYDLGHIVPTDGYVNSKRSNYAFGEVSNASYTYAGSKLGSAKSITTTNTICGASVTGSSSATVFEPVDEYKGDFARMYMYMVVRYKSLNMAQKDGGTIMFNTEDTYYRFTQYSVALLMKWHRQDPVSQKEIDRNNGMQTVQGNRNPFIDYPCLAEYLWGNQAGQTVTLSNLVGTFSGSWTTGDGCPCGSDPAITLPSATEIYVGATTANTSVTKTVTVQGVNLTGNISLALSGTNSSLFSINATSMLKASAEAGSSLTITYTPTSAGNHTATLTISGGGLTSNKTYTLTGTCCTPYNVTLSRNGITETISTCGTFTLPTAEDDACDGWSFAGWTTNSSVNTTTAPTFTTSVSAATTLYAVYSNTASSSPRRAKMADTWSLVTDATTLKSGDVLVIASNAQGTTAGDISSQVMGSVSSTFSSGDSYASITSLGSGTVELTLGGQKDAWTLTSSSGALGATAVKKLAWASGTTTWSISIASGNATITNGTSSYGKILYNVSSPRFTTYTSDPSSTMLLPQLYRKSSGGGGGGGSTTTYKTDPCSLYTITLNGNGSATGGTFEASASSATAGTVITLDADPSEGYELSGWTVTKAGGGTVTVTNNQFTMPEANVTVTATFSELTKYNIRFYNNGTQIGSTQQVYAGSLPNVPADPTACEGYTFVGWWTSTLTASNTDAKTWVTDFSVTGAQDYYAVYSHTVTSGGGSTTTKTDELNLSTTGVTSGSTSYSAWSGKTGTSGAVYAGNSAGGNSAIQLRTNNNNSGIVTTTSGGTATKVVVTWNSNTADGRSIEIYGKSTAYTSAADLYDSNKQGTSLGTIAKGSTTLNITGTYAYIGIRSTSGALYLDDITITWSSSGGGSSTTYYTSSPDCSTPTNVTVTFNANDGSQSPATTTQTIDYNTATALTANTFSRTGYTFQGWATSANGSKVYNDGANVTLTENTTLYAVWTLNSYSITTNAGTGGTLSTSPAGSANYGATVTITATPDETHTLGSITVKDASNNNVTVTNNQFIMPASNVTVSATFSEKPQYTINFIVNGETVSTQNLYQGATAQKPSDPTPCDGYTFAGWWTAAIAEETTTAQTWITDFTVSGAQDYYAIFSRTEGSGSGSSNVTVTKSMDDIITANNYTISSGNTVTCYTSLSLNDDITLSTTGSANCGSFWGTSPNQDWRLYQNQSGNAIITAGTGCSLTAISITYGISNTGKLVDLASGTEVSVSGSSVTYIVGNSGSATNGQVRIKSITVKYTKSGGSSTTTYYTSSPECVTPCTNTPEMSFANTNVALTTDDASYTQAVTVIGKGDGQTVAYSSSDETVATVNASGVVTLQGKVGSTTITASVAENGDYCEASASYTITVTKAPCVLTGITLNTEDVSLIYTTGNDFSTEELIVTANYSNCADAVVTPTSISTPDMLTAGTKTITVTYTENGVTKTASFDITVSDPVTYTVTWSVNGTETEVVYNEDDYLVLPSTPVDCSGTGGKKFVGWTASSSVDGSAPADLFTTVSGTIVTADVTYYAVFATATTTGSGSSSNDFELYSGALTEGDYLIVYDNGAMNTTVSSNRLGYESVTSDNDVITTTDASIIWHIAASGDYWTLYNATANQYAGGTTTKNQGAMLESATDLAKWTVTGTSTYDFENLGRANGSSDTGNKWLRKNGNYGFACYGSGTGGALSLYKKKASSGATTYSKYSLICDESCTKLETPAVAAVAGNEQITLTWADVEGADHYTVAIGTGVGYTTECGSVATVGEITHSGTTNTCVITNLTNGLAYTTTVVAHASDSSCDSDADEDTTTPLECNPWDDPTVSWSTYSLSTTGTTTATLTVTGTEHGTRTYESSDVSVLTIAADGTVTAQGAGTATVTVLWTAADGYCEKSMVSDLFTVSGQLTVTFNANDGTDEPATKTQTVTYNVETTLDANAFTRTGYTFAGWNTQANGQGTAYADEAQVTLTSSITLFAMWQINSHNVSYTIDPSDKATVQVNGSATTPQSFAYGTSVTVAITPDNAYEITSVTATDVTLEGSGDTRTFTMPDNDVAISITLTAKPTHTVTWSVNGSTTTATYYAGQAITFPATAEGCDDKVFVGWCATTVSETDNEPTFVTAATMGDNDITYYAVFATATTTTGGGASSVVDELTLESTGVSSGSTTYSDWSGVTGTSGAVYAGQSAGDKESIQLRSKNNNSGIITTSSGGKATKVTVVWNSNTDDTRIINVYGKNSAYSAASDLYGDNAGTLIGTIATSETELIISDNYEYIGIRSASGALYLDKVSITWTTGSGSTTTYSGYTTSCETMSDPVDVMLTVMHNGNYYAMTDAFSSGATEIPAQSYYYESVDDVETYYYKQSEPSNITWRIATYEDSYYITNAEGKYLTIDGENISMGDEPFAWSKNGGGQLVTASGTGLCYNADRGTFVVSEPASDTGISPSVTDVPTEGMNWQQASVYTRENLNQGHFVTICLPYNVCQEFLDGVKAVYNVSSKVMSGGKVSSVILMPWSGLLLAGTPYVVEMDKSSDPTITLQAWYGHEETYTDDQLERHATGLVGNLGVSKIYVPVGCYGLSNNLLRLVTTEGKASISQYKAYFDLKDVVEATTIPIALGCKFMNTADGENVVTVVDEAEGKPAGINWNEPVYNILGIRVGRDASGVLIQNGIKFLVP